MKCGKVWRNPIGTEKSWFTRLAKRACMIFNKNGSKDLILCVLSFCFWPHYDDQVFLHFSCFSLSLFSSFSTSLSFFFLLLFITSFHYSFSLLNLILLMSRYSRTLITPKTETSLHVHFHPQRCWYFEKLISPTVPLHSCPTRFAAEALRETKAASSSNCWHQGLFRGVRSAILVI